MMRVKNTHITKANSVTHSALIYVRMETTSAVVGGNTVPVLATLILFSTLSTTTIN